MTNNKFKLLALSLLIDGLGIVTSSYIIPVLGDFGDIVWAPFAGWLMTRMYKGNIGKAAGIFTLIEEAIPGLDIIPTFTIMWIYTHVFKKQKTTEEDIIDVDVN